MSGTITTDAGGGSSPSGPTTGGRSLKSVLIWSAVAAVGAVCWTVLALVRGETVSALWILFAALSSYAIGYRFYARFITYKVLQVDDKRATPAERLQNGVDFDVTDRRVLFGHHFAAIAGAGPLVGPVLAAQMGYLPGTIWIVVGVIFAGAVQDLTVMFFSMRRNGKSLGQMVREEIGIVGGIAALIAVFTIMIIILAVLALIVVNALAESPWGVFSIALTIPIALFMGVYLRRIRPGRVLEATGIGVALLLLAIVGGGWIEDTGLGDALTLSKEWLVLALVIYGFVASVLPVWLLLTPRDYLSTFMKIGVIVLLAISLIVARPVLQAEAVTDFAREGTGPVFAGSLFPFVFITIACGALSGFHALIASGTTPKMLAKESQVRLIGYGGMLMESFVAISALIAACVIDQGLYFAMNSPAGATGGTVESAAAFVNGLGLRHLGADAGRGRRGGPGGHPHLPHRWRPDAGRRHLADLQRRVRRRWPGVLVPLRDHVRGAVHPHRRRRRHPGRPVHAAGHDRQRLEAVRRPVVAAGQHHGQRRSSSACGARSSTSA